MFAVVIVVAVVGGIIALGGGNTLTGFGNDLQKSGERIHNISHKDDAR